MLSFCVVLFACELAAGQGLQITYGNKGLETLTYAGVRLADTRMYGGDTFHIWHMQSTDLSGNVIPGWGENKIGESWNPSTNTETYNYPWGTISTQFVQAGDQLNLLVTAQNSAGSGIIFQGAEIFPVTLHFPNDPSGFAGYTQYAITTTGPGVSTADFGSGVVTSVVPNEAMAMYGGWKNVGSNAYSPLMTTTSPDGLPNFLPHINQSVAPGSSMSYTVSLRFTPAGAAADASDAYRSFASTYPSQMTWSDHRILGTAYLASSPQSGGSGGQPGGFPTNPRRYFNDPSVDITTPWGLQAFQSRMLAQAVSNVNNAQALNSQGVITWDIEGEEYPQATSYVCSPDQIGNVAPEMESTITNSNSVYYGQKLDDAYFRTMTAAGLKVGVCLRPQVFTVGSDRVASQVFLGSNAAIVSNLENKARYANTRWGATIFYVDSTVDVYGGTLDPAIFQQLITDLPGFLFIPEESTPRYYAYTAPFYSFLFHSAVGTDVSIYNVYPNGFGANLVNDADPGTLAAHRQQLTHAVSKGDILMGHADYWQANNPALVSIYQAAGSTAPPSGPVAPSVTWSVPSAIPYGTALSPTQLNATSSVPGSFVYTPAAGTLLKAGNSLLQATFTPADPRGYKTAMATVGLTVLQAAPIVSWATPAAINSGTPLNGAQLNASANVPGNFIYSPPAGTVLPSGNSTLQATFRPADATNYSPASASVNLSVLAAGASTPALIWNSPAPVTYGTALSVGQLNASANTSGTFTYNPALGTVLNAGTNILTAMFAPNDPTRWKAASAQVTLNVVQAIPILSWSAPGAIFSGTPLSAAQLNASSNVAGTFTYNPAPGTVLNAGIQTLSVSFHPNDSVNYQGVSRTVSVLVTAPQQGPPSRLAITSPSAGAALSGRTSVSARCTLQLDAAGTHLLVDGVQWSRRVAEGPFVYWLDTSTLSNGPHMLQVWAHDTGNNTTLSDPVAIVVAN